MKLVDILRNAPSRVTATDRSVPDALALLPAELARYFARILPQLYARTSAGSLFIDALVNIAVQETAYLNWAWHASQRQRLVVQIGGLQNASLLAAALGNPRQAVVGCPWPQEPVHHDLTAWVSGRLADSIRSSGVVGLTGIDALARELSTPCIGSLILHCPAGSSADEALQARPLIERCDRMTDVVVCGTGDCLDWMQAVLRQMGHGGQRIISGDRRYGGESFLISKGTITFEDEPDVETTPVADLPTVRHWHECDSDVILEVAPACILETPSPRYVGCAGLSGSDTARAYDYMTSTTHCPAAEYYVLHHATFDTRGRVFRSDGSAVREATPPYNRAAPGAVRSHPIALTLQGTWLYIPAGGLLHSHFLIEGLLRAWVTQKLPGIRGLISPIALRGYQREMLHLACGGLPVVTLSEVAGGTAVEKLVAWRATSGHSPGLDGMIERMHSQVTRQGNPHIFITRSERIAYRRCINQDELVEKAKALGYTVIDPGELGGAAEIQAFAAAEVVVGALGAGMNNVIFCSPGTDVIIYTAKGYAEPYPFHFAAIRRLRTTVLFCEQIDAPELFKSCEARSSTYFVDVDALGNLMDVARRRSRPSPETFRTDKH